MLSSRSTPLVFHRLLARYFSGRRKNRHIHEPSKLSVAPNDNQYLIHSFFTPILFYVPYVMYFSPFPEIQKFHRFTFLVKRFQIQLRVFVRIKGLAKSVFHLMESSKLQLIRPFFVKHSLRIWKPTEFKERNDRTLRAEEN